MGRNFAGLKLLRSYIKNEVRGVLFINAAKLPGENNAVWALSHLDKNRVFHKRETKFFTKNWDLIEFLLSSPEPSTKEIDDNGNPIYDTNLSDFEQRRKNLYPGIVNTAITFTEDILALFEGKDIYIEYSTIVNWFNSFIDFPKNIDIKGK